MLGAGPFNLQILVRHMNHFYLSSGIYWLASANGGTKLLKKIRKLK